VTAKQKRAFRFILAFFFLSAAGLAIGAVLSWSDEHGGIAGKAHVTKCISSNAIKNGYLSCDATWTYNGRTVTGYVENASKKQLGKTISVRIHGTSHVTNTTYWVPIGLALFALLELAFALWMLRTYRRRTQAT